MSKMKAAVVPIGALGPEEQTRFIKWAEASRGVTNMDPAVLTYSRSALMVAADSEVRAYATMQSLLFVDNLIPQPGLSDKKRALAIAKMERLVQQVARDSSHAEVMFTTIDSDYADVAEARGWQVQRNMIVIRRKADGRW